MLRGQVAAYPRVKGGEYVVIHDKVAHQGVGLYRVMVGNLRIGQQASFPSASDCERMERPAPIPATSLPTRFSENIGGLARNRRPGRPRKVPA